MLIYDALIEDHQKIKALLQQLLALPKNASGTSTLVEQIRDELIPHVRSEEAVFYNSLRAFEETKKLVAHSYKDHLETEAFLRLLQAKSIFDADCRETALKLQAALELHIQEEEERIFPEAKKFIINAEAEMMAHAFQQMKAKVKTEGFVGTTIDFIANLMPPRFSGRTGSHSAAAKVA